MAEITLELLDTKIDALRDLVSELLVLASNTAPAPTPVPVDPLPPWVKPTDGPRPYEERSPTPDYAEARRRALYGYGWQGRPWLGINLPAAWDEVSVIKALSPQTVQTYRGGLYALLQPDFACYAVLVGLIETEIVRSRSPQFMPAMISPDWAGLTVEQYLDGQWGITGGVGGDV